VVAGNRPSCQVCPAVAHSSAASCHPASHPAARSRWTLCIGHSILGRLVPAQIHASRREIVLLKRQTLGPKHIASASCPIELMLRSVHRVTMTRRSTACRCLVAATTPGTTLVSRSSVGIASGPRSLTLSPETDSYFCQVTVAPDHRRRRISTRLYAAVYETNDQRFPVLTRAMESQPLRRQFANALGCTVLVHCPAPWVDPTSPAFRRWADKQPVPPAFALVVMRELPTERVEQAWATYFEWAHRPFGVVHTDRLSARWTQLSSTIDQDASILAVDSTTADIVAISLATPDAWDGRTMIISETVHETHRDGSRLVRSAVAASLEVLGQRDIRRVELEGHTTDAHSPDLVESLPPGGGDPMDILKLAPPTQPVPQ
jgi:hypothetical protein